MPDKINLLSPDIENNSGRPAFSLGQESGEKKFKSTKKPKKILSYMIMFLIIALGLFSINANKSNQYSFSWLDKIPIISQIKHLAESASNKMKGEDRDSINILLLGMGGKNHEGGLLTDTIILASLKPSVKKVALVSIPRDLSVPIENMGWRKINNVNALAEIQNPGSGGLAISQTISDVLKVPVDYYVRVDFAGFEKIIDELGGVKIFVENPINDYRYPIAGKEDAPEDQRYEHLQIDTGWQKMDGQLALKYARSRHTAGIEGSDFARARRQQKILEAVKEKVISLNILFKPTTIAHLISTVQENFSTNLKIWELVRLWDMFKNINTEDIINKVLDNSPSGLLIDTIGVDGAYLLIPRNGDFSEVQYLINNIFEDAPVEEKTKVRQEKATVEVRNGTWINGLANEVALDLEKYGFDVIRIGNASQQNFQKSVIYDLTYGAKIESLSVLKNKTNANVSLNMPQWLMDDLAKELAGEKNPIQSDFILILGQEADRTKSGLENKTE